MTIWCTGLGAVSPTPPTGGTPPPGTVPVTEKTIRVLVGGVEATVIGAAVPQPTNVGLNQINIFVPEAAPLDDQVATVIEVDCGDGRVLRSADSVTIAVRAA